MARPRYPSDDDRTLRQGGIRISYEVLSPDPERPGQAEVFEDPLLRGVWLGLLLKAGKAFAGRTGDTVVLSRGDLLWITGEVRPVRAIVKLRLVCSCMGYSVRPHGDPSAAMSRPSRDQAGAKPEPEMDADWSWNGRSVAVHVKNLSQNQRWSPQAPWSAPAETPLSESESDSSLRKTSEKRRARRRAPPAVESQESSEPDGSAVEEAARAKLDRDAEKALRILSDQGGEPDEKRSWMRAELRKAEAWAQDHGCSTQSAVLRFWVEQNYGKHHPNCRNSISRWRSWR